MAGAPYHVDLPFTDDETFAFAVFLDPVDGTPINWPDYRPEYSIRRPCGSALKFDMDNGLAVDIDANRVGVVLPLLKLRPGSYRHGMRMFHIPTESYVQIFDGAITVTEGNFPGSVL